MADKKDPTIAETLIKLIRNKNVFVGDDKSDTDLMNFFSDIMRTTETSYVSVDTEGRQSTIIGKSIVFADNSSLLVNKGVYLGGKNGL